MSRHVAVIGAGIVGVVTALELVSSGFKVTLVEDGDVGGGQAASYGNGAWISPASVVPMSMPGLWRKVPSYLLDPTGPLTIRWTHLPRLLPWLFRFLIAGSSVTKVERTASLLSGLIADSPLRHSSLSEMIGRPDLIRRTGLLYTYPDKAAFEDEALAWRLRSNNGVQWKELDAEALAIKEPALSSAYRFGVFVTNGAHCVDPGRYVSQICEYAKSLGAELAQTRATGFDILNGHLRAVLTERGPIYCDKAVIAAGIYSKELARACGDRILLESERGYHVVVRSPNVSLVTPIMPSHGKQANTSTLSGLRAAGQVELCNESTPPDWRRADILLRHLNQTYPGLKCDESQIDRWMGHRPSTYDGLPVISYSSTTTDVIYAFGHGHVGLAAGPKTAELVRQLVEGRLEKEVTAFSASRFK